MKLILTFILGTAFSAHALETDNYLAWGITLPDASVDINQLIKTQIEEVTSSAKEDVSCEEITFRIANRFKTTPQRKLFEDWSTKNLSAKMYPPTPYYLKQSIYQKTKRVYLSKSGLSPNLQANGIYFGVDKLSHFGSTGRRYLKNYLKKMRQGYSEEESVKSAIRFGLFNEHSVLGLWPSGVFSYGDIEANFQGFLFYKNLCLNTKDTYLEKVEGRWTLAKYPDIKNYVNPHWDESFNLSYRAKGMWKVSSQTIAKKYCALKSNKDVQSRFETYQQFTEKSFSRQYIEELQSQNYSQAPNPHETQSIETLCLENKLAKEF